MKTACFASENATAALVCAVMFLASTAFGGEEGWLSWRGPNQDGQIDEKNLPEKWDLLWTKDIPGQSTPAVYNGRVYVMGYTGEGADFQEGVFCLDSETGEEKWRSLYNDFLSDIIYTRYASSAPAVDPETQQVYTQGSQGLLTCYTLDGKIVWQHSMMEEFGRMTFPNGRTNSPAIEGDLVITAGISANWGAHGPAAHRFYAFNKRTGELVWASQPGERPRDSSFSHPFFAWRGNHRVFYCGGGDGSVYCVSARDGVPIWRYKIALGGINANVMNIGDTVVAIHGVESIDSAHIGRMVCIKGGNAQATPEGPAVLDKSCEVWRNEFCAFAAAPTRWNNRIFAVDEAGHLECVNAETGKVLWKMELGTKQRTATLICAEGKLYIPIMDEEHGAFYIIKPTDAGGQVLHKERLQGQCFSGPSAWDGRVYLQTSLRLNCLGKKDGRWRKTVEKVAEKKVQPGPLAKFMVVPAEFLAKPGQQESFKLIPTDKDGNWLPETPETAAAKAKWEKYIPPTAKVKSLLNGDFTSPGVFKADDKAVPSAGAVRAEINGIFGVGRGRVLPALPISANFEETQITLKHGAPDAAGAPVDEPGNQFAYPPLPWIGARFKWEIQEKDGSKCLAKTVDNKLFQRAITFVGSPEMKNYTAQADVMSEGLLRKIGGKDKIIKMSEVGLINQRYIIELKGGFQQLEVSSNMERLQVAVPFAWTPGVWYTLKTRVDIAADGSGVVRAKAWKRGDPEPAAWTIEVPHKTAHKNGSPGIFGFSPNDMPCYVDNLTVTPN